MDSAKKKSVVGSIMFAMFLSTIFAGCYYDRDDDWGYHRYSRRDYDYYDRDRYHGRYYDRDRDWRDGRYSHWDDYRYRGERYGVNRIDPLRNHYND